ncbi:hypothetical protein ASPBRDRAFT_139076, partial [Aspergillus brasiliensis CBS 101740]
KQQNLITTASYYENYSSFPRVSIDPHQPCQKNRPPDNKRETTDHASKAKVLFQGPGWVMIGVALACAIRAWMTTMVSSSTPWAVCANSESRELE